MAYSEAIKKAMTPTAIDAVSVPVLAMTEANEDSRMATTGTGEANSV